MLGVSDLRNGLDKPDKLRKLVEAQLHTLFALAGASPGPLKERLTG